MKKKTMHILMVLLFVSSALGAAVTTTTSWDTGIGFKIHPINKVTITDASGADVNNGYIQFPTPLNDGKNAHSVTTYFDVEYHLDTAGKLMVFFSSNNDLGKGAGGVGAGVNEHMLLNKEKDKGLNFSITRTPYSGSTLSASSQGAYTVENATSDILDLTEITGDGTATHPTFMSSGVCFSRVFTNGVEGKDRFDLSLNIPKGTILSSGLYSGYVIIHYQATT